MFQVLPDVTSAPVVDVNFLNDYVLNPIIEQLDAGFGRMRGTMTVGIGICLTLAISDFAYAVVIGAEHFAGGLRRLLGLSVWLYIIRDFSAHAHALMNSLVNVGMAFGGGGNWRETLNPSRIAAKGFELGAVLLDNMPSGLTLDLGDILGVGIGFVLIQACFGALVLNVGLLVIGFYMALPIAGFFSIFGLLPQTRGFAMRGITAIVSYGVHFALAALSLTLSESVIRGLHFSPEPTMHEIWAMVFVVMLLTVFAWWGPQRVAASFMNGAVGVGGGEAAALGTAVGGTAMAVATGAVGAAALGLDKVVQGLDNRPRESAGGGGGAPGRARRSGPESHPAPARRAHLQSDGIARLDGAAIGLEPERAHHHCQRVRWSPEEGSGSARRARGAKETDPEHHEHRGDTEQATHLAALPGKLPVGTRQEVPGQRLIGLGMQCIAGSRDRGIEHRPERSGSPRAGALLGNIGHLNEHYGNLVTYMRMKGVVPPSSRPR